MIKKLIGVLGWMFLYTLAYASTEMYPLEKAPNRISDMAALQNGAKLFVNNCLNCHSAESMRYNKLTELDLTDQQISQNLLFTGQKVGDLMTVALRPNDAKVWFGTVPPDLSVIVRAKSINAGPSGADYVYTYLRTFYRDASKPTGWDNLVFPSVSMPHVLWYAQGLRELTTIAMHQEEVKGGSKHWKRITTTYDPQGYATIKKEMVNDYHGHNTLEVKFKSLEAEKVAAYDNNVADLVAFMSWMSEPAQQFRKKIGVWVLLFLGLFMIVAWRLNASYWKYVR